MNTIEKSYEIAKEMYASIGIDTDKAIEILGKTAISLQCWQGDDVVGFENQGGELTGGIMSTGNYPGKASTVKELQDDLSKALSLIPGFQKVSLHASYLDNGGKKVDRDEIEPKHFEVWTDWAKKGGLGLDFNPTLFSHPLSGGFTLASGDESIRKFWIEHCKRSRKIGEYLGRETGKSCVTNLWIPDGYKDVPIDRTAPRARLKESLDEIFSEKISDKYNKDAVECKLFGIGSESYVVGSHEFYTAFTATHEDVMPTLDSGHFHPTETISDKISALLLFNKEILLHVSRGVRWDSDHVVTQTEDLQFIMNEAVRCGLDKVNIALDYFDGSINRIAAWVIGTRSSQKALLRALLTPTDELAALENGGDYTSRLALIEEYKNYPDAACYDYFCYKNDIAVGAEWLREVKKYESDVLAKRG